MRKRNLYSRKRSTFAERFSGQEIRSSLLQLASTLVQDGRLDEAQTIARQVVDLIEGDSGASAIELSRALGTLGKVLSDQGRYQEAEQILLRSLAIKEAAHEPDRTATLSNMAVLTLRLGRDEQALEYFEQALQNAEELLGENHIDVAGILHNTAILHRRSGRPERAEVLFERSLAIKRRVLGEAHPSVAFTLDSLGSLEIIRGNLELGAEYYLQALEIKEASLGPDHPSVATRLYNLGALYVGAMA
jgi:tetratricopeptide (TPR) repeat protein